MKNLVVLFFAMFATGEQSESVPKQLLREVVRISGRGEPGYVEMKSDSDLLPDDSGGRFLAFQNAHPVKYAYTGRVTTCRAGGCVSPGSVNVEAGTEFFDYFILFDSAGKVLLVQVYNYEATHGHEITVRSWLRQFTGYDGRQQLTVGKDIDVISGATISVYSISNDISDKTNRLWRMMGRR